MKTDQFSSCFEDCEDHAVLLCSLLLGFGLNAYVCVGTKAKGAAHTWVMTISPEGEVTFWESLTAHRYSACMLFQAFKQQMFLERKVLGKGGRFLGQFSVLLFRTIFLSKQVFKRGAKGVSSRLTKQIVYLMSTSCLGDLSAAINSLGKPTVRGFEHT